VNKNKSKITQIKIYINTIFIMETSAIISEPAPTTLSEPAPATLSEPEPAPATLLEPAPATLSETVYLCIDCHRYIKSLYEMGDERDEDGDPLYCRVCESHDMTWCHDCKYDIAYDNKVFCEDCENCEESRCNVCKNHINSLDDECLNCFPIYAEECSSGNVALNCRTCRQTTCGCSYCYFMGNSSNSCRCHEFYECY
jgi:hypothetical protein